MIVTVVGFVVASFMIFAVVASGLYIIARWDEPLPLNARQIGLIFVGVLAGGILINRILGEWSIWGHLLLGVFAGCLLLACITDSILRQVHCFVWWMGMAAGVLFWMTAHGRTSEWPISLLSVGGLLLFGILQYSVFGRTYGRADCHAFFACALVETVLGAGMEIYFIHMILAYLLLIIAQLGKGNVSKCGKLRCPVPFLTYINISFWLTLSVFL